MEDRQADTIDAAVMSNVAEHSSLVSDEWPAHKYLKKRLEEEHGYVLAVHLMVKHKETFCKKVKLADGTAFYIHTNKQEGLHAHLKKKMKNMMGTSVNNVEGYIAEAVFKLNCAAKNLNVFEEFLSLISI